MAFARETLGPERTNGIRLEEIESTDASGKEAWLITLSMLVPSVGFDLLGQGPRSYKIFTVLKSTGEVTAMKIRELATT